MPTERNSKLNSVVTLEPGRPDSDRTQFIPVAIPGNLDQSRILKADLEACDIPVLLDVREAEMDEEKVGGIPVLVPECIFERASQIVGDLELNALDDEDDFEDDEDEDEELEELDDEDEEEDDEEWDEDDEDFEDEDEEEEEEEEEEGVEDFESLDDDEEEEDLDDEEE